MIIGDREIGLDKKPYFIADIAANHNGDLQQAYKLIELAKESGADVAKFQNFKAEKIVSDTGFKKNASQLSHQASWKKSVFEVYQDASVDPEWSALLKEKCDEIGIEYMTSPYDFDNVDLADHYVNAYKIGSGDITWTAMLQYIADKGKPILLATGASEIEDVRRAVALIPKEKLVLMQCNTNYTAKRENFKYINLNVLNTYAKLFSGVILGLSDHTHGCATVLAGVALGARVIEKHFTDDQTQEGPDHAFSMTPESFREMVEGATEVFEALGDGVKRVEENEKQTVSIQRRGLYFTKNMKKGEVVVEEDVEPLRPKLDKGIEPYRISEVIGKRLKENVERDQPVFEGDVE